MFKSITNIINSSVKITTDVVTLNVPKTEDVADLVENSIDLGVEVAKEKLGINLIDKIID